MNVIPPTDRPRYSNRPLPPYSYVPGYAPHPVSDVRGHMRGRVAPLERGARDDDARAAAGLDHAWSGPAGDMQVEEYRYGVDLFNHGYYWEAHEAWESLWRAAGRAGDVANWLKALIKLAAAAVKLREGNERGVERHARRSLELLDELAAAASPGQAWSGLMGVRSEDVRRIAVKLIQEASEPWHAPAPLRVLDQWLPLHA